MKIVRVFSRILIGCLFIFSGFVKGVDPQGFAIKLSEYMLSFGLPEWETLMLIFSIAVSSAEMLIGICLFIGLRINITAWAALIFMSFFTLLTFYSAIANPVSDCGCFGDAIVLTNWQTFFKNLVLIIPTIVVFWQRKSYNSMFKPAIEWGLIAAYAFAGVSVFTYCYKHLPIIDFRPYHVGADIKAGMTIPEGAVMDEYKTLFYYKKDGVIKEFTEENYPWSDSSWTWVETKPILIKKGYTPPIHDFSISSNDGEDITDSVLTNSGYSLLLISSDISKANVEGFVKASKIAKEAIRSDIGFYSLTSSSADVAASLKKKVKYDFTFYATDQTTLKTIIRSNPGLVLLKEGIVIGQWHYNDFPEPGFFSGNLLSKQINSLRKNEDSKMGFLFIALFLLSVSILYVIRVNCNQKGERL